MPPCVPSVLILFCRTVRPKYHARSATAAGPLKLQASANRFAGTNDEGCVALDLFRPSLGQDRFEVRLAESDSEIEAALRLRYDVFVAEMGANARAADHVRRLELDRFDDHFDQMLLIDHARPDANRIVGVYRLMTSDVAQTGIGFYSASEYDLTPLVSSGRVLLELGRSCLHPDYRGTHALHMLWSGLAGYVFRHKVEVLFGVASFPGQDPDRFAAALSFLHQNYLAPPDLLAEAIGPAAASMERLPPERINRTEALLQMPALIKGYLRLGGFVGSGVSIDRDFNTVDICMVMDTARMSARYRDQYAANWQGTA